MIIKNLKQKINKEETFMPEANIVTSQHRPLMAGISIMPSTGGDGRGTLAGIARRKSDGKRVLVSAVHVVSTGSPTPQTESDIQGLTRN